MLDPTLQATCVLQIKLGDETMSVLEIWGAEYQENDCLLIKPEAQDVLQAICDRERCYMQVSLPAVFLRLCCRCCNAGVVRHCS